MEIERFKSKLTKGQIEAMAVDESKNIREVENCIDAHIYIKRAKYFIDTLLKENQTNALLEWDSGKADYYKNVTLYNGKRTYDFKHIDVWSEMEGYKKDIEACAKRAIESKTPVLYVHPFTGETIVIDKPGVKSSGETLNVKL